MRRYVTFAVLLCLAASTSALDIKGIRVDVPVDCEFVRSLEQREGKFYKACESRREYWFTQVSFLSGRSMLAVWQTPEGIATQVSVNQFDFQEALDALTLKFGKPRLEVSSVQNRMGASFEQIEAYWTEGQQTLRLAKHGAKLDEPVLTLIGAEHSKQSRLERERKAKTGAGNI